MALTQEQVDAWFEKNFEATPDDVAKVVQSIGGLDANEGLAGLLANRYKIGESDVKDYYNAYTAPAAKPPTNTQQVSASTATPPDISFAQQYLDANPDVNAEFELFKTQDPSKWTPESYASYHYGNYGKNENRAGTEGLVGNINTITNQILGQNLTSKWTGEGFGSAEANARDMANILTSIGIKDIKDFGQITKKVPRYTYDDSGNQMLDGYDNVTTYGNKKTGQEVPNTYGERQKDNAFGGTFTGNDNTGYRVQFAPDGTPVFYTTPESSNDLVTMFANDPILGAIAQAGAAYFGGPLGSAALNAAMGKDVKDIAKSAVLSYLGNEAFKGFTDTGAATNAFGETGANFAKDIKDVLGETGSKILGKTAGQFVANEGNVDIGSLLVNQGIGAATSAVLDQIPDFKTLDPTIQKLVTKTVSNTLSGGPNLTPAQLVSTALTEGLKASKSAGGGKGVDQSTVGNFDDNEITRLKNIGYNNDQIKAYFGRLDNLTGIFDEQDEGFPVDLGSKSLSSVGSDKTNLNTDQDILNYLDSLGTDTIKDSGLSNQDILNMIGAGTDDTVTVTGDRPTGLGDFMLPTDNVSNVADKGEMVITGNKNGTSLDDFLSLNAPAGDVSNNYIDSTDTVLVTGKRHGLSLDDFLNLNNIAGDTIADDNTVVINGKRECAPGFHDDGSGLCVADDDEEKPTDCPDGYILDLETNQCVKVDDTGVIKTVPPTKKITTTTPTTTTKTAEDLMGSLGLGRQAPSQDPYANIKLMEELFGGDVGYKLRALGAPKNLASSDMDALVKLLRG